MRRVSPGDLYLARLLARPALKRMLLAVFLMTCLASLYLRVVMASRLQVLPWYGVFLALYGLVMSFASSDFRCRTVYMAFGILIGASFSRVFFAEQTRVVGVVEAVMSLLILLALAGLARDERFMADAAMLESLPTPDKTPGNRGDDDTLL